MLDPDHASLNLIYPYVCLKRKFLHLALMTCFGTYAVSRWNSCLADELNPVHYYLCCVVLMRKQ